MAKNYSDPTDHTRSHYEEYPFEFMTSSHEAEIKNLQPRPFLSFINQFVDPADKICEVGCGPGRATMYLDLLGLQVTAVDLSPKSVQLAKRRAPNVSFVLANNLSLPFCDEEFDIVISDGVIHHTASPRCSFRENARILRKGGYMYLCVYNSRGYYPYIYKFIGPPIRLVAKTSYGRFFIDKTLLVVYHFIHLLKSPHPVTWRGSRSFFYDYIITPTAHFLSKSLVLGWAAAEGLVVIDYFSKIGNSHAFVLKKR